MGDRQPLNATFFAFRKREKKGVLVSASIAYVAVALLLVGGFLLLNAQALIDYINWAANISANATGGKPGAAPAIDTLAPPLSVYSFGASYLVFIALFYMLRAAYEAACLRWMIRGETGGLLGLSLGADTWRVYFTYWVWLGLLIAFNVIVAIFMGGAIIAVAVVAQNGGGDTALQSVPLIAAGVLSCIALAIYFGVRFAPAAATSVARGRFSFFDAWTVTKGRFWPLFGAFVLLILMFLVFYFIVVGVMGFGVAGLVTGMVQFETVPKTPQEALRALANPPILAIIGLFAAVMVAASLTLYVSFFGVNARAAVAALEEGKIKPAE